MILTIHFGVADGSSIFLETPKSILPGECHTDFAGF